jgi:conjugative transfer signal peptidase TraF
MRRSVPRTVSGLFIVATVLGTGVLLAQRTVRLNLTGSLPLGLYRVATAPPTRGAIVLVCLPPPVARFALARAYVWHSPRCATQVAPIGKMIAAMAGDTVTLSAAGLTVNGCAMPASRPLPRDARGRPLPHYPYGPHVLPAGAVWLFSPYHPRSFDSRYFGPVPLSAVVTSIVPVWTTAPHRPLATCLR